MELLGHSEPRCIVCLESGGDLCNPCNCKEPIHVRCLVMAIEKTASHSDCVCPVCKSAYRNVRYKDTTRFIRGSLAIVCMLAAGAVLGTGMLAFLGTQVALGNQTAWFGVLVCLVSLISIVSTIVCAIYKWRIDLVETNRKLEVVNG